MNKVLKPITTENKSRSKKIGDQLPKVLGGIINYYKNRSIIKPDLVVKIYPIIIPPSLDYAIVDSENDTVLIDSNGNLLIIKR